MQSFPSVRRCATVGALALALGAAAPAARAQTDTMARTTTTRTETDRGFDWGWLGLLGLLGLLGMRRREPAVVTRTTTRDTGATVRDTSMS